MTANTVEFGIKQKSLLVFTVIFLALLIFSGFLGITSLNTAKKASLQATNATLLEHSKTFYLNHTNVQKETLSLLLKTLEDDARNLADFVERLRVDNKPLTNLTDYFELLLKRNIHTKSNFFVNKEGDVKYYQSTDSNAVLRPNHPADNDLFYTLATPANNPQRKLQWTPLYQDPAGLGRMVSAIVPVYFEDQFVGVVGTSITLQNLVEHYVKADGQNDSYAILLDQSFRPVALGQQAINDIYRQNPLEVEQLIQQSLLEYDSDFKGLFKQISSQSSGYEKIILAGQVHYFAYSTLDKQGWLYGNILSEKALISIGKPLNEQFDDITEALILKFALPTLAFFVAIFFLISWLLNRFLRPIIQLSDITKTIAVGAHDQEINIKAVGEIGMLVDNFKLMQQSIVKQQRGLENFNSELQEKVAVRTEAIEASNEALQTMVHNLKFMRDQMIESEKMASLGTLTAGVAHEINNPTNFVHVSVQNLEADLKAFEKFLYNLLDAGEDGEIQESFRRQFTPLFVHISTIEEGTERIKTIVQNLRTFSHPQAVDKKILNVADGLSSTIKLVQTKHTDLAEFVTDFKDNPALLCYPSELNQVFMNLIINACDAIRDKREKLKTKALGKITIGCQQLEDAVEITVQDDGCGMNEITKHRLFEPFFTTKDVGEGTGLGLSISYGIIQKHEGEMKVESEIGVGTLFRVILPICGGSKEVD
ncbi:MAG: HAMP domain-containing protein [Algicola sp.]|nr:HAMP domain-containing protein [Algicola sp.]